MRRPVLYRGRYSGSGALYEYEYVSDRGPVFPRGADPLGASSDPRPWAPLRGVMDLDVVDVREEECQPVFPVRP